MWPAEEVSLQWKNPDFLFKNPDFLLKNVDFIIKQDALPSFLLELADAPATASRL